MSTRIIIAVAIALLLFSCSTNKLQIDIDDVAEFKGTITKVAILPLKANDSQCRNVIKIMSVRDFDLAFQTHPQYRLQNMSDTARLFKDAGYNEFDELEKDDMQKLTKVLDTDVLIFGNVTTRGSSFSISTRFYSSRSDELKQFSFSVTNDKNQRLNALVQEFLPEIDRFVSIEVDKLHNIAIQNYLTEKYTEAEAGFKTVIGLDPQKHNAYYYLGMVYGKQEKYELAEQNLDMAIRMDAENQDYQRAMLNIYEQTDQPDKLVVLMENLALKNEDEELWLIVANLHDDAGNKVKAKEALNKSLEINPDYVQSVIRLSFLLYEDGEYAEAIPILERAAEIFPDNELVTDRLAASYFKANRINEAIARYENIVKNDPNNAQAYLTVAGLYRTQAQETKDAKAAGDLNNKAIKALNDAKKIDGDNALIYLNLAAIYLSQKKYGDAETNANAAISRNSQLYQPYIILSSVAQVKGTEQYNRMADLEKQLDKAVGKKANQLKKDRDTAKSSALNFLRNAKSQLESARSRATDNSALADINSRINSVNGMINQIQ